MTIKQDIRDQLVDGPMSLRDLAQVTGHPLEAIRNARNYLVADGVMRRVAGQPCGGIPDVLYELTPIKAAPQQISRLTVPAWVPPKVTHRPVYDAAPGVVIREGITGRELADRRMAFAVA